MQQQKQQQPAPQNAVCHMHGTQRVPAAQNRESKKLTMLFQATGDKPTQHT
jgi:hypothetical protein